MDLVAYPCTLRGQTETKQRDVTTEVTYVTMTRPCMHPRTLPMTVRIQFRLSWIWSFRTTLGKYRSIVERKPKNQFLRLTTAVMGLTLHDNIRSHFLTSLECFRPMSSGSQPPKTPQMGANMYFQAPKRRK